MKFLVPGIICPLLVQAFSLESLTDTSEKYSCTWAIFLLFGAAIPVYTYCCSFLFKNYSTAQFTVFMLNLVMGAIVPLIIWVLRLITTSTRDVADSLMWPARLSPMFCFAFGIMNIANIETYRGAYGITRDLSPFDWLIAGADLTFLVLIAVFSLSALFLIEYLKNIQWIQNIVAAGDPGANAYRRDNNVEEMKVAASLADPQEVAVKVTGLRKVYGSLFSQVKVAIQEVSFTVPYQECFALLGVNGAGKTSVFRILTGEYSATEGDAFINGYSCVSEISKARYNIGYCPQFDALSELLTAREHLRLYARIKGIPSGLITQFVERQLNDMGLRKYEHTRAGNLSGGNKRKLAVAMATIGNPPVVFLDEPSAGMDPEARKNMWRVINRLKRQRCSIILTTHSMDEAEALCNTIGIMVAGRFRCYGTSTQIKNSYSKGYEIQLKVLSPTLDELQEKMARIAQFVQEDSVHSAELSQVLRVLGCEHLNGEIDEGGSGSHIKKELEENRQVESQTLLEWVCIETEGATVEHWLESTFRSAALLEHHGAQYTFNVEPSPGQSIGSIFGLVEEYKAELRIGDYSISQTTLEQVFNMFATELPLGSVRLSRSQVLPVN